MRKSLSAVLVLVLLLTGVLSGTVFAKTSEQRTVTGEEPTKAGSLFAGWFEDAEMTTPITAPAANSQAYAKFVDEAVLSVKYQITADANETMDTVNMRVVTATDSLNYANVGFKLEYGTHTGADA
ncbi:MAG: hypothetical protein IK088_08045, partial [Lachnospiraceae bacterium]|nr:hypothetical protein [Lachnospiraceae bacterium]